jgi:hypothetical protein
MLFKQLFAFSVKIDIEHMAVLRQKMIRFSDTQSVLFSAFKLSGMEFYELVITARILAFSKDVSLIALFFQIACRFGG